MTMRYLLAAALALAPAPALACLPPPPDEVPPPPPSAAERAASLDRWATDIAYGVVLRGTAGRGLRAPLRVIHVYKGRLKPGQVIRVASSNRFSNLPCPGMFPPHPLTKGDYGTIAFDREPEAAWLSDEQFDGLVAVGAIRRASRTGKAQRVGTGSSPE